MSVKDYVGFGLRPNHYKSWNEVTDPIWVEVMTDNYIHQAGGRGRFHLNQIVQRQPTVMHGVGLNIAGTMPLSHHYFDGMIELAETINPKVISDHMCFTRSSTSATYDLLPIPYTFENLSWLTHRVNEAQRIIGRRLSFENLSRYVRFKTEEMSELEFMARLSRATGCGILLDVNNVLVSCYNLKTNHMDELKHLEAWMVTQYHVAGHTHHGTWLHDTHDQPVTHDCWQLLEFCLQEFGMHPVILENDDPTTSLAQLISEMTAGMENIAIKKEQVTPPRELTALQNRFVESVYSPPWQTVSADSLNIVENLQHQVEVYRDCFYSRITQTLSDTLFSPLAEEYGSARVQAWLANYAVEKGYNGLLLQDNLQDFVDYLKTKNLKKEYPNLNADLDFCLARWTVLTSKTERFSKVSPSSDLNEIRINPTAQFVPFSLNRFTKEQNCDPIHSTVESPQRILFRSSETELHTIGVPDECADVARELYRGASLSDALEREGAHHKDHAQSVVQDWLTKLFQMGGLTVKALGALLFIFLIANRAEAEVWKEQTRRLIQVSSSVLDDVPAGLSVSPRGILTLDVGSTVTLVPAIDARVGSKDEGVPNAPVHLVPTLGLTSVPVSSKLLKSTIALRGWYGILPSAFSKIVLGNSTSFTQSKFGLEIQIIDTEGLVSNSLRWGTRVYYQVSDSKLSGKFSSLTTNASSDSFESKNIQAGLSLSANHKSTGVFGEALALVRHTASEFFISEDQNLLIVRDGSAELLENFSEGTLGSQLSLGWHMNSGVQFGIAQLIIPSRLSAPRFFIRYQSSLL